MYINIKHASKISLSSIVYILTNFAIGISLLCIEWVESHKYTMSLALLPLVKSLINIVIWGIVYLYYFAVSIKGLLKKEHPPYNRMIKEAGDDILGKAVLLTI